MTKVFFHKSQCYSKRKKYVDKSSPLAVTLATMSTVNIRALREKKGWTVHQLAGKMNVQPSTVSRWERGLSHPYSKEIPKLEKIFKIKIRRIGVNGRER